MKISQTFHWDLEFGQLIHPWTSFSITRLSSSDLDSQQKNSARSQASHIQDVTGVSVSDWIVRQMEWQSGATLHGTIAWLSHLLPGDSTNDSPAALLAQARHAGWTMHKASVGRSRSAGNELPRRSQCGQTCKAWAARMCCIKTELASLTIARCTCGV